MAFPTSPTNGQQANINGITYTYSSALTAWTVSTSVSNSFVSISVSGNVNSGNVLATGLASVTGNIAGSYFIGNGSQLTGVVSSYGNANVVANLAALGSNPISTTGNITGGNILGGANVNATTYTGTTVSVSANVTGGNLLTGGLISAGGNITGGNLTAGTLTLSGNTISSSDSIITIDPAASGNTGGVIIQGNLSVTGNVTYIDSNTITTNDLVINMANNAATAAAANGGGIGVGPVTGAYATITYNSTGNIWVISNGANVSGAVSATGNITGGNLSGTSIVGTLTTAAQTNITSVGTLGSLTVTANTTSGNLLIGGRISVSGTNPSIQQTVQNAFLDLCGGTTVGTDPSIQIAGSTTTTNANKIFYNSNAHVFRTSSGGTTYATIDTGGNFGIGTTSPSTGKFSDASYAFLIQSASTSTGTNIFSSNSDNSKFVGLWSGHSGATSSIGVKSGTALAFGAWSAITGSGGFTTNMTLDAGANLSVVGDVIGYASSDKKFKTNIRPIPNALSAVEHIGGKLFDWTDEYMESVGDADGYFRQKEDFGIVAQDVQKVFPLAVRTRPDGSLAVDYVKLSALAFASIAELSAKLKDLEGKINDLTSRT